MKDKNIPMKDMFASTPLMNRRPFEYEDAMTSKASPPTLEF